MGTKQYLLCYASYEKKQSELVVDAIAFEDMESAISSMYQMVKDLFDEFVAKGIVLHKIAEFSDQVSICDSNKNYLWEFNIISSVLLK